jgi:sensor histidine kinase YesM
VQYNITSSKSLKHYQHFKSFYRGWEPKGTRVFTENGEYSLVINKNLWQEIRFQDVTIFELLYAGMFYFLAFIFILYPLTLLTIFTFFYSTATLFGFLSTAFVFIISNITLFLNTPLTSNELFMILTASAVIISSD